MSFADQLRAFYVLKQPGSNTAYNTSIIFAGVYDTTKRECVRQASGYISAPPTPASINWRGAWNNTYTYAVGDGVTNLGVSYVCILTNVNVAPPNALFWSVYTAPV